MHPLVLELTGKTAPRTGLEGKFSVYHACAAGIVFGQAGEAEFSDAIVARPDVIALRDRITRERRRQRSTRRPPTSRSRCTDGRTLHLFVEHAIGSLQRPMSDADLARKFHGLVDPVLGAAIRGPAFSKQCAALAVRGRRPRTEPRWRGSLRRDRRS